MEETFSDECEDNCLPKKHTVGKLHRCCICKFESKWLRSIRSHEQRIHFTPNLYDCCGEQIFTKGDYYIHCEQKHPETRLHRNTSRTKYKITSDTMTTAEFIAKYPTKQENTSYLQLQQKSSERIRDKKQRVAMSKLSPKLLTYSDTSTEDVSLVNSVTDHRHKSSDRLNEKANPIMIIVIFLLVFNILLHIVQMFWM